MTVAHSQAKLTSTKQENAACMESQDDISGFSEHPEEEEINIDEDEEEPVTNVPKTKKNSK